MENENTIEIIPKKKSLKDIKIGLVYSEGNVEKAFPYDCKGRSKEDEGYQIEKTLEKLNLNYIMLYANENLIQQIKENNVDLVFNMADSGFEMNPVLEPHVPAILDIYKIPYTGSNYLTLGTCLDKIKTKQILKGHKIPTPKFAIFPRKIKSRICLNNLKFPMIIKPSKEDGSIGLKTDSIVNSKEELILKINEVIEKYNQPVLVEEFIEGREVYVGILGREDLEILPLTEMEFNLPKGYNNFLPYEAKWDTESVYYSGYEAICPAKIEPKIEAKLKKFAKKAYRLFEIRDYGRFDFRIDKAGKIYLLDINPNPDISEDISIARMAKAKNISYEDFIKRILEYSLK